MFSLPFSSNIMQSCPGSHPCPCAEIWIVGWWKAGAKWFPYLYRQHTYIYAVTMRACKLLGVFIILHAIVIWPLTSHTYKAGTEHTGFSPDQARCSSWHDVSVVSFVCSFLTFLYYIAFLGSPKVWEKGRLPTTGSWTFLSSIPQAGTPRSWARFLWN